MSENNEQSDNGSDQLEPQTPEKVSSNAYWQTKQEMEKKGRKLFRQEIYYDWCKACGICIAFCPKNVFVREVEGGKPRVEHPDECIGCRFCELHCPDFAITISSRYPDRRKKGR